MTYDSLRDVVSTGDLVLFSGRGFVSDIIKRVTHSEWSHVGMVVRAEVLGQSAVLLWESTTLCDVPDIEHGHGIKGVQLVSLSKRVATYAGRMAVRHLRGPRPLGMGIGFMQAHDAFHEMPYEQRLISLAFAGIGLPAADVAPRDAASLFCSEVMCLTYAYLFNTVPWWRENPTTWSPKDFSGRVGRVDQLLPPAYTLGSEILID